MLKVSELLELSHPLLATFKEKAPGSYKHCQNVTSICEVIAKALNLQVTTLSVAAMYHDIGKIFNPKAFGENMNGINIHDGLAPDISYQLISRHLSDSVYILATNDFPLDIIQLVAEHHGTTHVQFFLNQALKINPDLNPDSYRYNGIIPASDESAILMIVDTVEATARSIAPNGKLDTPGDKEKCVDNTLARLIDDGQLDRMTIGTQRTVRKLLIEELAATYHTRVDYDESE